MIASRSHSIKAGVGALILAMSLFLGGSFAAHAAAPTMTLEQQIALIQQLLSQIQLLQKQLAQMQATGSTEGQKNTCLELKNNLGYRSSDSLTSNEVTALQDFLQSKGYLNSAPTGFYGVMTTDAVKSFQSQYGLTVSGYAGSETRGKVKELTCASFAPGQNKPVTPPPPVAQGTNVYEFNVYDQDSGQIVTPKGSSGVVVGDYVKYVLRASAGATCYVTVGREGEGIRNEQNLLYVTVPTDGKDVVRYDKSYGPIIKNTYFISSCTFVDGSSQNVTINVTPASLPAAVITSATFSQDGSATENPSVKVYGQNLGGTVKLEYRATSEQPTQTVEGSLTSGTIGKDSYASFNLDTFLGNAIISTLKVRVVNENGTASSWVVVRDHTPTPGISSASFTNLNSGVIGGTAHQFNFTVKNWKPGLVLSVEPKVNCDDQYLGNWYRNCAYYHFDISEKASESYVGVQGDPYVKGGATYNFTGTGTQTGDTISILGYPDSDHVLVGNETSPIPDSITYRFFLRDTANGGTDLWTEEHTFQFKG